MRCEWNIIMDDNHVRMHVIALHTYSTKMPAHRESKKKTLLVHNVQDPFREVMVVVCV